MTVHQGNRYGRSEEARTKVLHAADDLLTEVGFAGVTIEGIARRAGVSKQTIYRWWPGKTDVLLGDLITDAAERLTPIDTGSLGDDLRAAVGALVHFLAADDAGRVLIALSAHARLDPTFAAQFDVEFLADHREREVAPFRRAMARGELAADFDIALGSATLYGPLYVVAAEQLMAIDLDAYVETWLAGRRAL